MKKITLILLLIIFNSAYCQIELEKSIENESLQVYSNNGETYYYTASYNLTKVKIYNSDFSLKSEFTPTLPNGITTFSISSYKENLSLSKNVFNSDDFLEIVISFGGDFSKNIRIYNENGTLIKDFGSDYYLIDNEFDFYVYHDEAVNENKLRLYNDTKNSTEIYNLPSSTLANQEIENFTSSSTFYPNPAKDFLYINNIDSENSEIIIIDINGKLVKKELINEENIKINIKDLNHGLYFYKVGNKTFKFLKQ